MTSPSSVRCRIRPGVVLSTLGLLVTLVGCTASETGVEPPSDDLFFPTGLAVRPGGDVLFVTNGNSDLRYNGGTLLALDLEKFRSDLDGFRETGEVPAPEPGREEATECRRAPLVPYLLECRAPRYASWRDQTIKLGNFAGQIALSSLGNVDGAVRLFIPVRGEPSLTWVSAAPGPDGRLELSCGNSGTLGRCGDANRISEQTNVTPSQTIPGEPFGIYADERIGALYVTSFAVGPVSIFDIHEVGGPAPTFADQRGQLFTPDSASRLGSVAVASRPCRRENGELVEALAPDGPCDEAEVTEGTFVYATSHYSAEVAVLTLRGVGGVCRPELGPDQDPCKQDRDLRLISTAVIPMDALDPANDTRGLAFTPDGTRLFVVDRRPPGLIVVDTSLEDGLPRNERIDTLGLCPEPSLLYLETIAGRSRAYVVCFAAGTAYVIDTAAMLLADTISLGQGPNAMAFDVGDAARPLAFVANYVENAIAVVDLQPGSATENQVIARIGYPNPTPVH